MKFEMIPLEQILVEERAREEIGDLTPIVESAKSFMGQIQSIAVKETGRSDKPYKLLAGGRRTIAFAAAGMKEVLCRIYPSDLTPEQEQAIELTENVARLNMNWQEQLRLIKRIHETKVKEFGEQERGPNAKGWSKLETANLVGLDNSTVGQDLALAEEIERNPELLKCKTKTEAKLIIAKAKEEALTKELAKRSLSSIDLRAGGGDAIARFRTKLINSYTVGDAFELIKREEDEYYDMVELDPPWANEITTAVSFRGENEAINHKGFVDIRKADYPEMMKFMIEQSLRVLEKDGWLLIWHSIGADGPFLYPYLQSLGFQTPTPAIWLKNAGGRVSSPHHFLSCGIEAILYIRKGDAYLAKPGVEGTFIYNRPTEKIHPTEKPRELLRKVYTTFLKPATRMLIPFLGSGNGILAGADCHIEARGYDISPAFKDAYSIRAATWVPIQSQEESAKRAKTRKGKA